MAAIVGTLANLLHSQRSWSRPIMKVSPNEALKRLRDKVTITHGEGSAETAKDTATTRTSDGKKMSSPKKEKVSFEERMIRKKRVRSGRLNAPDFEGVQPSQRADVTEIFVAVGASVGFVYCFAVAVLHYTPESVA